MGTKFGGKPGAKKPFKPYKNTEKSRPGKPNDGKKPDFSKAEKRKRPAGGGGEFTSLLLCFCWTTSFELCLRLRSGPPAKREKSGKKPPTTEEELKKRLQKKRDLKNNRQQAERKEMFDIISRCKAVWGNLRRYGVLREEVKGQLGFLLIPTDGCCLGQQEEM